MTFGLFEADLQSGELWKAGKRIKLQSQPFKVLAALLERPGEVVSREDLQLRLWGKDTIVDFEHSLGTAINKIREALSDSAENPRFIETLARRGYRFIAPVSHPVSYPATSLAATPESAQPPPAALPTPPAHRVPIRPLFLGGGAILALAAALGIGDYIGSHSSYSPPRVTEVTHNGRIAPGAPSMESLPATDTDGVRIFSPVIENGRPVLSQVSIADGDVLPLSVPGEIVAPSLGDLSPDGSKLLLRSHLSNESEQPLWVVPVDGGSALRVSNILAHDAAWMPDGDGILYAAGDQLFITHLKNGVSTALATLPGRAFWLRWSPDGKLLRFTIIDPIDHTMSLWELPSGSHAPRAILPKWSSPASDCCGSWTADGKYFVFQSAHDGSEDIWRLSGKESSGPTKVTNGPLSFEAPVPGRTGHRIFFLGLDTQAELLSYNAARKEFVPENNFLSPASRVTYSRDRQWVAWTDAQGRLWRARVDGSEKIQLTPDALQVFLAHWSPDGKQLALMAREPGMAWKLYSVPADGGSPQLLFKEDRNAADPDWSADGNSLVFGRVPDLMGKESGPRAIQVLDLRTHTATPVPGSDGLFSPRWSPDGRYIAAMSLDQQKLMLYDVAAKTWRLLAQTSVADPVWSADSTAIYIHAFMSPTQPIYRVDVPSGRLQQIADLSSFPSGEAADYFFCGITPENVPLVRARTSTGNIYSLDLDSK